MRTPVVHPGKPCPLPIRPAALDHQPAGNAARPAGPVWPFDPFAPLHPGSAAGRRPSFALAACCRSCRSAGPAPAAVVDPAPLACCLLPELLPWIIGPPRRWPAGPPAAVVDPAPLACCLLALAAALACHDCRAAGLASFTPRSTPHITPPQHHAGGPPAPGSNTYGVALIVTRCTITLHAHPR